MAPQREQAAVGMALAAVGIISLVHINLVFNRSINWDEFYYFGQIHRYQSGQAIPTLQTLHTVLFGWLTKLPGSSIDHIIVGRAVMFGCELITAYCIALIARKFVSWPNAYLASAAYLSAGFVVQHGWAFRTDPLVTMLTMTSLTILARSALSTKSIVAFGVLLGTAGMVSMKSILIGPAFAGLAWLRWKEYQYAIPILARMAAMPILAVAFFVLIYWLHSSNISVGSGSGVRYAASASRAMFFLGIPEYLNYALKAAESAMPLVILLIVSVFTMKRLSMSQKIAVAGLISPVLTVAYYHNTLPYYYAFMLPSIAAGASIALPILTKRYGYFFVASIMVINALAVWVIDGQSRLEQQRAIQSAADDIFAQPVSYIDFPHFLPHFAKVNGFMTHWGLESYLRGRGPSFIEVVEKHQTPLILTVDPTFDPTLLAVMEQSERRVRFREEDKEQLPATFRQFFGPIWIAGTEIKSGHNRTYDVIVAGPYTVSGSKVIIDGEVIPNGEIVVLPADTILIENQGEDLATLTWGENLKPPSGPVPARPYWTDF